MRDIEASIHEYCTHNLPVEPVWIAVLNRWLPKIAARLDVARSVRWEIADHLRNSYETNTLEGNNPDDAWKLALERFGDISTISQEILRARAQSYKCLMIRFLAIIALFVLPLGKIARISIVTFFHPHSLFLIAACAGVGFLVTRKRDLNSLRKYAFYGAWLGLFWGIFLAITAKDPSYLGAAVAMILMSTFYGLFLAAPKACGFIPVIMMLLCHFAVLISTARFGLLSFYPCVVDAALLKMVAEFSLVSVLVGLIIFDVRKLHNRLAGVAAFSMVFAYIQIFINLTRSNGTLFIFICATSITPLIAVLSVLPIRKLQDRMLHETN
jgi:hypothetical protein